MSTVPYIAGNAAYRYPKAGDAPAAPGTKCLILTEGGVCVIGVWGPDSVAWAPLPKRNREKEELIHAHKGNHMKLYKIVAAGSAALEPEAHWVGSQADAASRRKQLNAEGFKRADIETLEVDVPTDKVGLLAWLNASTK